MNGDKKKAWTGTTFGTGWMHIYLTMFLRYVDVRFLYVFAAVFIVPVCFFSQQAVMPIASSAVR